MRWLLGPREWQGTWLDQPSWQCPSTESTIIVRLSSTLAHLATGEQVQAMGGLIHLVACILLYFPSSPNLLHERMKRCSRKCSPG